MRDAGARPILKRLAVDALMAFVFLILVGFALWLTWIYFYRGPTDIETRGFVTRTIRGELVQPTQVEKYTLEHFHNLDELVLGGIQSESLCVKCHGDYPHSKDQKARAFFNAHSWFMACEVCHVKPGEKKEFEYKWFDNKTGKELTQLTGTAGNYGGLIVPTKLENGEFKRLDIPTDIEYIERHMRIGKHLDLYQIDMAQERIHKSLTKSSVSCEECHTKDGLLKFKDLLYPPQSASHLESIDMGAMIQGYQQFHLPGVFETK